MWLFHSTVQVAATQPVVYNYTMGLNKHETIILRNPFEEVADPILKNLLWPYIEEWGFIRHFNFLVRQGKISIDLGNDIKRVRRSGMKAICLREDHGHLSCHTQAGEVTKDAGTVMAWATALADPTSDYSGDLNTDIPEETRTIMESPQFRHITQITLG